MHCLVNDEYKLIFARLTKLHVKTFAFSCNDRCWNSVILLGQRFMQECLLSLYDWSWNRHIFILDRRCILCPKTGK